MPAAAYVLTARPDHQGYRASPDPEGRKALRDPRGAMEKMDDPDTRGTRAFQVKTFQGFLQVS